MPCLINIDVFVPQPFPSLLIGNNLIHTLQSINQYLLNTCFLLDSVVDLTWAKIEDKDLAFQLIAIQMGKPYGHNHTSKPNVTNNIKVVLIIKTTKFRGGKECFVASSAFKKYTHTHTPLPPPCILSFLNHTELLGGLELLEEILFQTRAESRTEALRVRSFVSRFPQPLKQ